MEPPRSQDDTARRLAWFFHRNGYVRRYDPRRREAEGAQRYKKGFEVRLVATTTAELALIRRLLRKARFKPARPYAKGGQFCQPVYGREATARFLDLVGAREQFDATVRE